MKVKKVLVTGVSGQTGSIMVDYLLKNTNNLIIGGIRRLSVSNHKNIEHLKNEERFRLIDLDVTDQVNTTLIIQEENPDYFINFAANSFVGNSWKQPINHMNTNCMPVMYQLEAIRRFSPECRYYNAGTSEMFGDVQYSPQGIDHPLLPRSPYGVSKCAAHHIVKVWRESYNLYAVQGVLFNHESERRGLEFLPRKVSSNVARIKIAMERGVKFEPMILGNLDVFRDWSDAADMVDGIWKMLNQKAPKDYVLASGETHSIRELVETAFAVVNIKGIWRGDYFVTDSLVSDTLVSATGEKRPAEVNLLCGDSTPARKELGWKPKTSFKELIKKMVLNDYELQK